MSNIKICYFGIYPPTAPRDKVYLEGLKKLGVTVVECVDNSTGLLKFFRLAKKHRQMHGQYEVLWVGYLSTMVVPLAWLVSRIGFRRSGAVQGASDKRPNHTSQYDEVAPERSNEEMRRSRKSYKIVFNALDSWYDRAILDRGMYSKLSPVAWLIWCIDFLAFNLSDIVLVESEQQKLFIAKKFFVNPKRLRVIFTGVDENVFHSDLSVKKTDTFTVIFRGMFLPATGVEYIIEAARLLKDKNINFRIIGWGQPLQAKFQKMIKDYNLVNVNLTTVFLSPYELRNTILSAHVMLGQFSGHPRLDRTIQNKTFEALALGMPYITRDSLSNRELLVDRYNSIFVPCCNAVEISKAVEMLKNDGSLRAQLSGGSLETHTRRYDSALLGGEVLEALKDLCLVEKV